jgi:hypothetical protein
MSNHLERKISEHILTRRCHMFQILHSHSQLVLYTRKNAQTCDNTVPTTCQQDVFALLVPSLFTSCQRLVGNLLQGC